MAKGSFSLRDLIARIIVKRDKSSADKAESEVKGGFDRMAGFAKKAGLAIAAAFSIAAITNFAKSAVQAAVDAERSWNRLAGTLASAGVEFEKVERRIRAGARAMKEAAGIGDDEYADTLARLVSLTGDFNLSLGQMGLVADVAARFFAGDLAAAVDVVGRALAGNTRGLRALGIMTDDVNEGLRILAERSAGAAANELNSLDGRLKQLKDSVGEVTEELGFLILRLFGGGEANAGMDRFRKLLDGIADSLARIKTIKFKGFAGVVPVFDFDVADKAAKESSDKIATLDPVLGIAKIVTPEERAAAAKAAEERRKAAEQERFRIKLARDSRANATRNRAEQERVSSGEIKGGLREMDGLGMMEVPEPKTETLDAWTELWGRIEDGATNAMYGVAGAFQDTFALMLEGTATIGSAFETLGRGIAGALIGGIAEYAAFEVKKETALGVGALAAGTWPPNPLAIKAALGHFQSAGLWAVLAGAAGAAQSGIAGGSRGGRSGGIPSGASDIGGRIAEGTDTRATTIIYIDGFDPMNPVHVRTLGQGMKKVERSDSSVEVRSRSGAG